MKDQKIESRERLTHIREAIHQIEVFIQGISKEVFLDDQLVASAVLFQFSVIGEAIIHVDIDLLLFSELFSGRFFNHLDINSQREKYWLNRVPRCIFGDVYS